MLNPIVCMRLKLRQNGIEMVVNKNTIIVENDGQY